jgi:hypothetical protein
MNLDLFIGQDLGGLFYLENDSLSNLGLNNAIQILPEINIYPNPANDKITIISSTYLNELDILIYTSTGKLIDTKKVEQNKTDLSIRELTPGMYILCIPEFGSAIKFIKQ